MFGVIETGSKQYKVALGDKIKIEKIDGEVGQEVELDKVLLICKSDDDVQIGQPYLEGKKVTVKIIEQGKDKKKIVFKYKPKKRQRTKKGHRQYYTKVEVVDIK